MNKNWFKLLPSILVLILGLAVASTHAAETIENAGEKNAAKETKKTQQTERYYEVMWLQTQNCARRFAHLQTVNVSIMCQ